MQFEFNMHRIAVSTERFDTSNHQSMATGLSADLSVAQLLRRRFIRVTATPPKWPSATCGRDVTSA